MRGARDAGAPERWALLRGALRSLRRAPALSSIIVLTLGVGIGANVALFSVLRGVILRPLPFAEPDRLVRLWEANPAVDEALHGPSPLNFADWEREAAGFESMAAWYLTSGTYRTDRWVEEVRSAQVTADFFRVLGVQPLIGRDFRPDEVVGYGPVMLSHRIWQRLFGSDPDVVGRSIVASGNSYEIVGVMPPGFSFPDEGVDTWIAWDLPSVYADRPETRTWRFLDGIGRLAAGTSPSQGEDGLDAVAASLSDAYPIMDGGWDAAVTSLHEETVGDVRATLWLAFGAVLFILLIACTNVANLLLARVPARAREIGIRTTLGATRGRVARELLLENSILAFAAGALGLGIGAGLLELLVALDAGRIPRLTEVAMDGGVLGFTVIVAATTSVVFGLAPVLHVMRGSIVTSIGDGLRATPGRASRRLREFFLAAQVAVALVLLTGAGLFARSLEELVRVDPGLEPSGVATFRVSLDPVEGTSAEIVQYYEGLLERLRELPGVEAVGAAQTLPLSPDFGDFTRPYRPVGSAIEAAQAPTVQMRITTPDYVEAIGMRVLDGSTLPRTARMDDPLVALVNETLAGRLWPDGGAVGAALEVDFRQGWQPYTVVGIVQDVKHYGVRSAPAPEIFLSQNQLPYLAMSVVARVTGDPESMSEALRSTVASYPPAQPAHDFVSLEELLSASVAEERFLSVLLAVLAGIGLVLATTGVYGVIAYSVSHRRAEIGVRMALGARPGRVLIGVLVRALGLAVLGMGAGLVVVITVSGMVESMLFGVAPTDVGTGLAVVGLLLAVATIAAYVPARRAASIAPAEALNAE